MVSLVIAQRLVRVNCPSCSEEVELPDEVLLDLGVKEEDLSDFQNTKKGRGCSSCNGSGYKGRMPIFEILEMTTGLRKGIINEDSNAQLKKLAISKGLVSLRQSALSRLRDGLTTVEEVVNTSVKDDL